jgi:type III secretion protein C
MSDQLHDCHECSAPTSHESHVCSADDLASRVPAHLRGLATIAAAWLVLSTGAMHATSATAGEPAWPTEPYRYTIVDQDLSNVLQEFGRNTGLRLEVSPEVRGRVRGPLPELAAREFIEHLARNYGFDWYFDGFRIYVTSNKEASSRLIQLSTVPLQRLESALRDLALYDVRFSLKSIKQADMAMVSGPPQYIQMVERTLVALKPRLDQPSSITVYRGEHVHVVKLNAPGDVP